MVTRRQRVALSAACVLVLTSFLLLTHSQSSTPTVPDQVAAGTAGKSNSQLSEWWSWASEKPLSWFSSHPIDQLVVEARKQERSLLDKQVVGVEAAAAAYRLRRGRHPPPRFDRWVKFAEEHDALLVEDMFDQLYNDIDPFWGVPAANLRDFPTTWPFTISIRNGTLRRWSDEPQQGFIDFMSLWRDGIKALPREDLPDVDLAFNSDDETHVFVPWEKIQAHLTDGNSRKHISTLNEDGPIIEDYSTYPLLQEERPKPGQGAFVHEMFPASVPLWDIAREACPSTTQAKHIPADTDYSTPFHFPTSHMNHMPKGYVSNWETAKSACLLPDLQAIHGSFVGMQTYSINAGHSQANYSGKDRAIIRNLVPLLSGCKIHDMNQEILIPPGVHWQDTNPTVNAQPDYQVSWENKEHKVMWRGTASGGINTGENWTRFQRHRFLVMTNGSLVDEHQQVAEEPLPAHVPGGEPKLPHNFPMPDATLYPSLTGVLNDNAADLGSWISRVVDAAFVSLRCWPGWGPPDKCGYNDQFYSVVKSLPGNELWKYKMLPDLDGASYSGRFRAFIQSGSLPVKATIYDEWSDSRLVPWRHFVPMDNSFVDWWGLLEYFMGPSKEKQDKQRDVVAKEIADAGADWAGKVLRRVDMEIYMFRLILELARVSDDKRDQMGYVNDLLLKDELMSW